MPEKKFVELSGNAEIAIAWGTLDQIRNIHEGGQRGKYIYDRRTDKNLRAASIENLKKALEVLSKIKKGLSKEKAGLINIGREYLTALEELN